MTGLPDDDHVLRVLRVLADGAAFDAAHIETGPGVGPLTRRYMRLQSCIDHLELMDTDEDYARAHVVAAMKRDERYAARDAGVDDAVAGFDVQAARARFAALTTDAVDALPMPAAAPEEGKALTRALAVARGLQKDVTDLDVRSWEIHSGTVSVRVGGEDPGHVRAILADLRFRFGLAADERRQGPTYTKVRAHGEVEGVEVEFSKYLKHAEAEESKDAVGLPAARGSFDDGSTAKAFKAAAFLQARTVGIPAKWEIGGHHSYDVDVMFLTDDVQDSREHLKMLAALWNLAYREEPRPDCGPDKVMVKAFGDYDGVEVRFWNICSDPAVTDEQADQFAEAVEVFDAAVAADAQAAAVGSAADR